MVALAAIAALIMYGCGRSSPREAARRYIDNLQRSNYAGCYAMLAARDRKVRTLAEFLTEIPLAPEVGPAVFGPVLHTIKFDVGVARRQGDRAFVPIKVTAPDLTLWERTLDARMGSGQAAGESAARSLATGDFPKVTYEDGIYLIREDNQWRVIAGFTDRDRIVDRHREAIIEYHQYQFAKVIADYKLMIAELERMKFTGAPGLAARYRTELAAVQSEQADSAESAAYAAKGLKLGDIAMRMSEERVPAIFGSITNTGTRALDAVQIAVTWYEGRGKTLKAVYSEKHPIVTTPIEFTDFSMPVLPFVPHEKRTFGFILTAPAQIQQNASPYVKISAVAFTEMKALLPKSASAATPGAPAAKVSPVPSPAAPVTKATTVTKGTPTANPSSVATPAGKTTSGARPAAPAAVKEAAP